MEISIYLLFVAVAILTQGCERRQVASQSKSTAQNVYEAPLVGADSNSELDEINALKAQLGVRSSAIGDIGFLESGMLHVEASGMNEILSIFRQEKIELALPDQILHGVGVWTIAPQDFDRALRVVERDGLRQRFPQVTFATREGKSDVEQKQD